MNVTAYWIAESFAGVKETPGAQHNALVVAMLQQDSPWFSTDETPWCSAFVNFVARILRLPRSKSARARSWLLEGREIPLEEARRGWDVVVLKRGGGDQPGPEVIEASGHVGFFDRVEGDQVYILGGNQNNEVNVSGYDVGRVLGVRRLRG